MFNFEQTCTVGKHGIIASHAEVIRSSSRVPAPLSGAGTRCEPLRTSAGDANGIMAHIPKRLSQSEL